MFNRETRSTMSAIFWMGITLIVLTVIVASLGYITLPLQYNLQRGATQHSNAYVQSKVKELTDSVAKYEELKVQIMKYEGNKSVTDAYKAQQAALVNQMHITYNLIPSDIRTDVTPQYIVAFLSQH